MFTVAFASPFIQTSLTYFNCICNKIELPFYSTIRERKLLNMPEADLKTFNLRDFMPYIMARVGSLMAQSFAPHLEREDISLGMWRVLMALHFNGPLSLGEIARTTGVNVSTLSRLIGRMEKRELVSRDRSRKDSRAVHISLLPAGEAMFQVLWPEAARLEDIVTDGFSEAEVGQLKAVLQEVENILSGLTEDQPEQS